jgi:hypothetical protein
MFPLWNVLLCGVCPIVGWYLCGTCLFVDGSFGERFSLWSVSLCWYGPSYNNKVCSDVMIPP